MSDLEDCPLTWLLLQWRSYLHCASPWSILRFAVRLPATKVGYYLSILVWFLCGPVEVLAAAAMGASLTETMVGIQWTTGTYSGLWCEYLMRRSRLQLVGCLNDLVRCTFFLEKNGSAATKESLRRTARKKLIQVYFYVIYGVTTVFGVMATFVTMRPHWAEIMVEISAQVSGVELPTAATVYTVKIAMLPVQAVGLVSVLCAYYTVLPLFFVLYGSAGELHSAIAQSIENGPCSDGRAAMQSDMIAVAAAIRVAVADAVPHILVVGIVLPLFCTVDVLVNGSKAGFFAINTAPLLLTILVASFETGETVASSLDRFATQAYSGPWLEEDVAKRRIRIQLMQASTVPSIRFHGRGVGELNRHSCTAALQAWFRFLQGVLNIHYR